MCIWNNKIQIYQELVLILFVATSNAYWDVSNSKIQHEVCFIAPSRKLECLLFPPGSNVSTTEGGDKTGTRLTLKNGAFSSGLTFILTIHQTLLPLHKINRKHFLSTQILKHYFILILMIKLFSAVISALGMKMSAYVLKLINN